MSLDQVGVTHSLVKVRWTQSLHSSHMSVSSLHMSVSSSHMSVSSVMFVLHANFSLTEGAFFEVDLPLGSFVIVNHRVDSV